MIVHRRHPYNAETPADKLRENYLTPTGLFYVRNHGAVPEVAPNDYRLKARGLVERPLSLSLKELKTGFPKTGTDATLYCAGNRRVDLMRKTPMPGKVAWDVGAVGNARWGGVLLRDVLREAGVRDGARHAAFTGLDPDVESGTGAPFGGSVPLEKALADDAILAYEMNGEPLTPEHGFPLRVVVGGYVGARSVKWLSEITLQEEPSDNHYQAIEYKLFPPEVTAKTADYSWGEMLGEIPLNAVICTPRTGETLSHDPITVRGYAVAGGGRRVERVEVSPDGGESWTEAALQQETGSATWRFWKAALEAGSGEREIVVRATDSTGGQQPESVEEIWNFQGYANNAWHRVTVRVEG